MRELSILGLSPGASLDEIKSAYKRLAKKYHPDINPHGHKVFIEISAAYEYLIKNFNKSSTVASKPSPKPEQKPKDTKQPDNKPKTWTPDLRYQFFDERRKRWISNRYSAESFLVKEPDADGHRILLMPKECFDYNGMIEYGNQKFYFAKGQPDGSVAEIAGVKYKIVYAKNRNMF